MLCYTVFMTLVFVLPINEARTIFKLFDPSFGVPLTERSYADDCRVYTPENSESNFSNIKEAVFDVHFVAHLGGWWFKMLIIRDTYCAWIISLTFELIEISFRHMLSNFWECWWDHLLLDLFGCNMLGIILGGYTLKAFGVAQFNWIKSPITDRVTLFDGVRRYSLVAFYVFFVLSIDTLNFLLKYMLWIEAESDLCKARVAIWAFSAIATTKEFYHWIENPNKY